ncbi:TIGR02680 family protein [Streptomyces sp. CB01881]|uniref:TIGR02680 family protein n=1 Tax=Streptomyces sp. CB01881 TaxID=2078691 RepID=UPI000CDCD6C7|nr:TIGR02680 family protein [Streptomyces sp. CB01881]AUY48290.1 TIGR02680 family protein [Streptomyces sp. CB01881]TYC76780.1 TIGR02680 family protein [Streptomyces sp. CB01881]
MTVTQLPQRSAFPTVAAAVRWRPSRAGILNVWRYYDETFTFHEGRLLLRGQNGTGKSKALEVLLPFLLDASLRPNRLSTFGGSERTMHWNLMGEGTSGKTRVGYVWLEFVRDDGGPVRFTCGARLQASVHTTNVTVDYFTTGARIDRPGGLALVNDAGQPLTRAALAEALQGRGELHGSPADYRTTVRSTLFPGLSEQRYDALITALLQLRTPKLSERLDPSLLSSLLSRALPPLGQGEITELAEGFERLDRQREHLKTLDEEVAAATAVANQQRGYAQRVLRAGAAALISATTEMDNLARIARESEEAHTEALRRREESRGAQEELEHRRQEIDGAIEGLLGSEVYRQGQELDQLRSRADQAALTAARVRAAAGRKVHAATEDAERADDARLRSEQRAERTRAAREETLAAARRAAMESVCTEVQSLLGTAPGRSGDTEEQGRKARRLLRGAVVSRHGRIAEVRAAVERHERSVADRATAEQHLDSARERLADATARREGNAHAYETAVGAHAELLRRWATADCTELSIDDAEELASRAAVETDVLALVEASARVAESSITADETIARAGRDDARARRDRVVGELERTAAAADLPPVPPRTRTADRSVLPGAPLWRLLAFRPDVPPADQAGVEAALEAGGLLDAWMTPDGSLVVAGHDTLADPASVVAAPGPSLLDVLAPEPDGPVPPGQVQRLLAGIAYGATLPAGHPAAVAADGSWRLATAVGSWSKEESSHIGAAARERARQRRIAELTAELAGADTTVNGFEGRLRALADRRTRLGADLRSRPHHREVAQAKRDWERAESEVGAREDAVREAVERLARQEDAVADALRALAVASAEHALPTERAALDTAAGAADALREQADVWLDAHLAWTGAQHAWDTARSHAEVSRGAAAESLNEAEDAEAAARGLRSALQAVESTVGEDYRQVAVRISDFRNSLDRIRREIDTGTQALLTLEGRIGSLSATMAQDAARRDDAVAARNEAAHGFRRLCVLGFPDDAGLGLILTSLDGTRATLEAARETAATWPNLPHGARNLGDSLNRLSEAVHRARQSLSSRADLELEAEEDIHVLTATIDGIRVGATSLLALLTGDRDRSQDDITAAERSLFDRTLTGDTRRHLASRIRQAGELVERMNGHLERVRTASRVAVRLVWQIHPDLPAGTRTARELLLKDPARITEADREALHAFFRGRIEEAKSRNTASTWEEQLADVLDYTAWHQFVVKLDRANGSGWQLLTKKLHGALSGGEKAIALHLPLFAAVAAHYEAVPESPRLILLDEVFVGVDTVNRGQVFGLLAALDLDLVLTSDHEWCTYRELSGIAVHQLITGGDGDDAVTSARFTWTGTDLLPDEADPDETA